MSDSYRFSRFVYSEDVPDGIILFNSLRLKPVILEGDPVTLKSSYQDGSLLTCFDKETVELLKGCSILTTQDADEKTESRLAELIPEPRIDTVCFILTERCNLNCRYCFMNKGLKDKPKLETMSAETAMKGLDLFVKAFNSDSDNRNQAPSVVLYGGEPLLNKEVVIELIERISLYKRNGTLPETTTINMNTNGTLLTSEMIMFLKENDVFTSVSLDGDAICNRDRIYPVGTATYDDVKKAIARCRENDYNIGIAITMTENVLDNLDRCLDEIISLGPKRVGMNPLLLKGKYDPEYSSKVAEAMIRSYDCLLSHGIIEDRVSDRMKAIGERRLRLYDCSVAQGSQIVIAPSGRVGTCHGMIGMEDSFITDVDSIFEPKENATLRNWTRRTPLMMDGCKDCVARGICGGGCALNALADTGDIFDLDRNCCDLSRAIVKEYLRIHSDGFPRVHIIR